MSARKQTYAQWLESQMLPNGECPPEQMREAKRELRDELKAMRDRRAEDDRLMVTLNTGVLAAIAAIAAGSFKFVLTPKLLFWIILCGTAMMVVWMVRVAANLRSCRDLHILYRVLDEASSVRWHKAQQCLRQRKSQRWPAQLARCSPYAMPIVFMAIFWSLALLM